jgi:hypothetical protein
MSTVENHTSDRDRICRLCDKPIARGEEAIVMRSVHVANRRVDLHFHRPCFVEAYLQIETIA